MTCTYHRLCRRAAGHWPAIMSTGVTAVAVTATITLLVLVPGHHLNTWESAGWPVIALGWANLWRLQNRQARYWRDRAMWHRPEDS